MQTRNQDHAAPARSRSAAAWLLAALIAGCGGGAALLVPFFTFGFSFNGAVGGANHDIFLNLLPTEPTTATGSFEAGSTLRIDTRTHEITGSYAGCQFTLNVAPIAGETSVPAPLAGSYNGRFSGPNTIELAPVPANLPVLTLARAQGADQRPQTC